MTDTDAEHLLVQVRKVAEDSLYSAQAHFADAKTAERKKWLFTESSGGSSIGVSVGAFYLMRPAESFVGYLGPRIGIGMNSSTDDDGTTKVTISSTDIVASLAIGGEHFLMSQFSLGAEADIGIAILGDPTMEITPAPSKDNKSKTTVSQSVMSTGGSLFARFYF